MTRNLSDIELLELLSNDHSEAFTVLFDRYHHAIYRNIMLLLHDSFATADLVQEVFIALWEKRKSLSSKEPVSGWLFTVSYYKTVDYIRSITRRRENLEVIIANESPAFEKEDLTEQQYSLLAEAMGKLSPKRKKVFELCKLQGMTYEQAAQNLGVSKYTVNEYMKDAMSFLRKYVDEHPIFYVTLMCSFFYSF